MALSLIGFASIVVIVLLLLSGRVTPIVPLVLVPVLGALLAGFAITDLGEFFDQGLDSVTDVAVMFIFAILFFGLMQDAGLFDPLINHLVRLTQGNVVAVCIGTVLIAAVAQLDGSGASTFLITIPALLPLYKRMRMNPYLMLLLIAGSASVMNMMPWAGPIGRTASVLDMDVGQIWRPLIPVQMLGMVLMLGLAVLLGLGERRRIRHLHGSLTVLPASAVSTPHSESAQEQAETHQQLKRPRLLWLNALLALAVIAVLVTDLLPAGLAFMIGLCIALPVNYPRMSQQMARVRAHAPNALMMGTIILAAGVFLGILDGTGMLDALAEDLVKILPGFIAPYLHLVIAIFGIPLDLLLSTDAYYFALLPIVKSIAAGFDVSAVSTAYAMIIGNIVGTFISPFSPALWLALGLANLEMGKHIRFALLWTWLVTLILLAFAVLIDVITL